MIGTRLETNNCGWLTIIRKLPNRRFLVRFDDGYEKITTYASIRHRNIKNPNAKTVFGVGFLGEGEYKCWLGTKISREYSVWIGMMMRCYNDNQARNLSYQDKTVCSEWHNFQNFAEWCQNQSGFSEGWSLDKDLLIPNSKVYSPDTCCFLPKSINSSLAKYTNEVEKCQLTPAGKWVVGFYSLEKSKRTSTTFSSYEEACEFYTANRFNQIKESLPAYIDTMSAVALERLRAYM